MGVAVSEVMNVKRTMKYAREKNPLHTHTKWLVVTVGDDDDGTM